MLISFSKPFFFLLLYFFLQIYSVISQAAASPRSGYFSIADSNFTEFDRVYCLAQCTRDLDRSGCNTCLRSALATLRNCCPSSVWSMVFMPSCQLRYDLVQFYNVTVHTPAAPRQANTPDMDSGDELVMLCYRQIYRELLCLAHMTYHRIILQLKYLLLIN